MSSKLQFVLAFLCLMLTGYQSDAQDNRACGSMEYLEYQLSNDAKRAAKMHAIERHTAQITASNSRAVNGIITIPVVVHIVYNTASENISVAQVQSQIDVLNEDFRKLNSDADNTWSQAADSEIEFCLATSDPSGSPTTGITRTQTSVTSFSTSNNVKYTALGGMDAWPSSDYLNIWVCDISGGILGYAQFPGGNPLTDGVVNDYLYFGTTGVATAPFDLGRTLTHEVGHWLNLRHIWGDGGCSVDDFVNDTPTSDAANYGCATGHVSCSTTDMVQNYMDYSDDACMNLFTEGQKTRMRALFEAGGARVSLLSSTACGPPADPTCTDGIQNGDETGIDCGGPECPECPPCTNVTVSIILDNYPEETSWAITNSGGTLASGGTYGNQPDGSTVVDISCLVDDCYTFTINDTYGDGICCTYGSGSYTVTDQNSNILAAGGSFGSSESTNFCLDFSSTSCTDGVQNGDETGVDCGGPDCPACPTCNDQVQNGNETGVDCGGPDCVPCATCSDDTQNGDETGVDCGGPDCPACPTCIDQVQNGNETGVDCGGPDCDPCATCNDNVQNGDETGVDCGGPDCPACPTCIDQVQNGNETGVDCGGPDCDPCATCNDNVQNGDETGVDCGGPDCPACPTCIDQVQNGNETGVDCGGPDCVPCATCSDDIQNGDETGVDCGGPDCPACPNCSDGVQNGDETGIDCGGPVCKPCGTGCNYEPINTEGFEGGFGIWNDGGSDCSRSTSNATSGNYSVRLRDNTSSSVVTTDNLNLLAYEELTVSFSYIAISMDNANEDFWLQISTDGGSSYMTVEEWNLTDEFVNGQPYNDAVVIAGPFSSITKLRFRCDASGNSDWVYIDDISISGCSDGSGPTCSDGIQNGNETGVDCGGPDCPDCPPTCDDGISNGNETGVDCGGPNCDPCDPGTCNYITIASESFESDFGIWNDGGSDCARSNSNANTGLFSVYLRDNSSTSVLTTNNLNLSSYNELTVSFSYIAISMDNSNEDFWLQISADGGSTYNTIEEWNRTDEFNNGERKNDAVIIPGPFTANSKLRFRCDASGNQDWVYLDDIVITGCLAAARGTIKGQVVNEVNERSSSVEISSILDINLYPNPVRDVLNISYNLVNDAAVQLIVMDLQGKIIKHLSMERTSGRHSLTLQTDDMPQGIYMLNLINDGMMESRKFIIQR